MRFEDAGSGVGLIEICRPEAHNALNRIAQDEFSAALAQAGEDPSIRCLVVA
ncbi:enoyl-CoA hydratase-related protein, partial [Amycolatopsis acidicola]|uniref:enoyl-CoA hydratase-related protein n=1 Tax=Amycolatopsis acidicola TaxID=2596893 RepID=UPI003C7C0721